MKKILLKVGGMTCSACSSGLEKYLKRQPGIKNVNINLILSIATIEYEGITKKQLEKYISDASFESFGEYQENLDVEKEKTWKTHLILMGILLIFMMIISMGHMVKLHLPLLNHENPRLLVSVLMIFTIFFLHYGRDILNSGVKNLIHRIPNMDTLVMFSVIFSILYSILFTIQIFMGDKTGLENLYFESACMVIYFVKLGRYIEEKSKSKTKEAIQKLVQVTPKTAIIRKDGKEREVSLDEIQVGDTLICKSFSKIAVDGTVVKGKNYVDESFITGESMPVLKEVGDKVIAGSTSYDGYLEYQAEKIGKSSTISEIVKFVVEATNTKNKIQRLADRISGYFVPIILGIASITLILQLLLNFPLEQAFLHFVTVLVVACPCSLGLAVPLVMVVSNGLCAKKGLFLKNGEALEQARNIDTIIFDKTGTLTIGKPKVYQFICYQEERRDEILNKVSNLESKSKHPIASAFEVKQEEVVEEFKTIDGMGITGIINNKFYALGNERLLNEQNIHNPYQKDAESMMNLGCSILYIVEKSEIVGIIGIKDVLRKETKEAIKNLKRAQIEVIMLTGDNEKTAGVIAKELAIKNVVANVLPTEKAQYVKSLVENKKRVMMVGDGVNDAIALVSATIGVSVKEGSDIAYDSADVILMNNNMNNILDFIKISQSSYRVMKENLFWAFLYNMMMVPLSMGLLENINITMNPMLASMMMTLSSITVVANSLRLGRRKTWKK